MIILLLIELNLKIDYTRNMKLLLFIPEMCLMLMNIPFVKYPDRYKYKY